MLTTRTVYGTILKDNNTPLVGYKVVFRLRTDGNVFAAGGIVDPHAPVEATTDEQGYFSVDLWCTTTQLGNSYRSMWEATLPGRGASFWLPPGGPVDLLSILSGGLSTASEPQQTTLQDLIAIHAAVVGSSHLRHFRVGARLLRYDPW